MSLNAALPPPGHDYTAIGSSSSLPQGASVTAARLMPTTFNKDATILKDYVHKYGNGLIANGYSTNAVINIAAQTTKARIYLGATLSGASGTTIPDLTIGGNSVTYGAFGNTSSLTLPSGIITSPSTEILQTPRPIDGTVPADGGIKFNVSIPSATTLAGQMILYKGTNTPSNTSIRVSSSGAFINFDADNDGGVLNRDVVLQAGSYFQTSVTFDKYVGFQRGFELPRLTLNAQLVKIGANDVNFASLEDAVGKFVIPKGSFIANLNLPYFSILKARFVFGEGSSISNTLVSNQTNDTRVLLEQVEFRKDFTLSSGSTLYEVVPPGGHFPIPHNFRTLGTQNTPLGLTAPDGVNFPLNSYIPEDTELPSDLRVNAPATIDNDFILEAGSLLTAGTVLAAGSQSFEEIRSNEAITFDNTTVNAPYTLPSDRSIPAADGSDSSYRIETGTVFVAGQTFPTGTSFYNGTVLPGSLDIQPVDVGYTTMLSGTEFLPSDRDVNNNIIPGTGTVFHDGFRLPGDTTIFSNPVIFPEGTVVGGAGLTLPIGTVIPPGFISPSGGGTSSNLPNDTVFAPGSQLPAGFQFPGDTDLLNIKTLYFDDENGVALKDSIVIVDSVTGIAYNRVPAGSLIRKNGVIPRDTIATQMTNVTGIANGVPAGTSTSPPHWPTSLDFNEWRTSPPQSQADNSFDFANYIAGLGAEYTTPIDVNVYLNVDYRVTADLLIPLNVMSEFLKYINLPFPVVLNQPFTLTNGWTVPQAGQFIWPANVPFPVEVILSDPLVMPVGSVFGKEISVGFAPGTSSGFQPNGGYIQYPEYELKSKITLGVDVSVTQEGTTSSNFKTDKGLLLRAGSVLNMDSGTYGYAIPSDMIASAGFTLNREIDVHPIMTLLAGTILPTGSHLLGPVTIAPNTPFPPGLILSVDVTLSQGVTNSYDVLIAADSVANSGSIFKEGTYFEHGLLLDDFTAYLFPVVNSPAQFAVPSGFQYGENDTRPFLMNNVVNMRLIPIVIQNLQDILDDLEQQGSDHQAEIDILQAQVLALQQQIANLDTLPDDIADIVSQLQSLRDRVAAIEQQINP